MGDDSKIGSNVTKYKASVKQRDILAREEETRDNEEKAVDSAAANAEKVSFVNAFGIETEYFI